VSASPWDTALLGQVVAGCRLDAYVGGGNFGAVFEATNVSTGSRFAVKVLAPTNDAEAASEFDSEGVLLRKLNKCSSVINWVESGSATILVELNGSAIPLQLKFHVLALASAALEELISDAVRRASLPWPERISHWRGAIKGVHQMHLNTVAHRDLKASNCLLMLHGGDTEVRVADLGRSKDFNLAPNLPSSAYLTGRGDLRFAPPEYLWWQGGNTVADFRSADLYGLGSLFVELATGHPITALAIGSWQDARRDGERDYVAGRHRDLSVLRPQYRRAIEELSEEFPPAIRHGAAGLLGQLCDPVPAMRQPKRIPGMHYVPDNGLAWLLRRADILSRRLSVDTRRPSCKSRNNTKWSAS